MAKDKCSPPAEAEDGSDASVIVPPDGGWGWVVVFASFMIHVIADGVTYTFGIFYVEFLKYFGESKGTTAWVASIMVGTTYCIGPVASGLTNKYGCRVVTIAGAVIAATGLILSLFVPSVPCLYFTIGLCTGAGFGLMYLPSIVSVTCYFEKQRAFATGMAVCGSGLGTFALAPLTECLVEYYGWKGAMLIIAGLVLNCAVFGALFRPLEPNRCPSRMVEHVHLSAKETELQQMYCNGNLSNGTLQKMDECSSPLMEKQSIEEKGEREVLANGYHAGTLPRDSKGVNGIIVAQALEGGKSPSGGNFLIPPDFLRRKVEGTPLSSFVCSSASLAQTNKELSQLESYPHSGLLYRKDIFYSGSLLNIPKYRSNPNLCYSPILPSDNTSRIEKRSFRCCPREVRDALLEMMDLSLLTSPVFLMFGLSNFLTNIGFNVPYVYTKDRVADLGIATNEDASFLLAIIGISNTVGRVTLGYLSDRACVNRLWVYNVSLVISGLVTALSCYATDYTLMAAYCATFGATAGAYVSLTSVILVDLLGLDRLTNAFGLLLVFEGVSCLLGPPITGWLYDGLGSYDPGFYVSGSMIAASGLMLFFVPCVTKPSSSHLDPDEDTVTTTKMAVLSV